MHVAIVGAGVTGLSAAYDLARAGRQVTVYESESHVGGIASGFRDENWDWSLERYYHHWFASDTHILSLIDELGAKDRVLFPRPVTVMYHEGRFHQFDSPLSALLYPGLGWGLDKIRFGCVGMYLRLTKNWKPLESVTVDDWMRRMAGRRAYETMWRPMLVGKFGEENAPLVNMAWFWARMHARTPRLGTFSGGFQAFLDLLAEHAKRHGASFRMNTPVQQITTTDDGRVRIRTENDEETYDQVLATTSPAAFSRSVPELPDGYRTQIENLRSLGALTLVLALDRPLGSHAYWYNLPKKEGFPFLALVEHTNYIPREHYGGDHIIYCGDYLDPEHPFLQASKEDILETYLPALKKIRPDFDPSWIKKSWIFRTRYAQPIPLVDHSKNIPDIKTPLRNLWLACMSQVYPWDRGTNFAVEIGRRVARRMLEETNGQPV